MIEWIFAVIIRQICPWISLSAQYLNLDFHGSLATTRKPRQQCSLSYSRIEKE